MSVRIDFRADGGFAAIPGQRAPVRLDTAELPRGEGDKLEALVRAAGFFDLPASVATTAPGAADYRSYEITVEEDGRSHSVRIDEPVEDEGLSKLVRALRLRA